MTDFATLGIRIDSTQTKTAAGDLDKLAAAGARTEAATVALAGAQAQAKAVLFGYSGQLKAGGISQEQFNAEVLRTKTALGSLEAEYRQAAAGVNSLRGAQQQAIVSTGAQRAGMQQL